MRAGIPSRRFNPQRSSVQQRPPHSLALGCVQTRVCSDTLPVVLAFRPVWAPVLSEAPELLHQ